MGLTRPLIFGIGLPIINVAKTNDRRGVGKLLHTFVVSLDKKCIKPNGPIDIPMIPEMTAIGNPNLSSLTASLNFLPKLNKKNIVKNPKRLISSEFEKKFKEAKTGYFINLN